MLFAPCVLPFPIVAAPETLLILTALKLTLLPAQTVTGLAVADVIEGLALTVTDRVEEAFEQPPVPVIV